MPDAITSLRDDHKRVEKLFKQFEKIADGDADRTKQSLVAEIISELSVHAAIEEQVFYPAVRKEVQDAEDTVLEGLEEHHIVKWTLSELDGMSPSEERFKAKVSVLIESVRHHVEEEEGEMFPKVREALGRKALVELGETMDAARKTAPKRPHPKAPDEPPGNLVAGPAAAAMDKATGKTPDTGTDKGKSGLALLGRRKTKAGKS
jgi:hemerythrin superfamily protein